MWELSIKGRVAAPAYARAAARVGALGFGEEFFCEGFGILALGDALLASAVAGLAAVEIERAGVIFAVCGFNVDAIHDTE